MKLLRHLGGDRVELDAVLLALAHHLVGFTKRHSALIFPEELGGTDLGYVEFVLVATELSNIAPSIGISVAVHNSLCTNHIYKFGSEEQRRRRVTPIETNTRALACYAALCVE